MTHRITTLAIATLALIGAETAIQHVSGQSLFGAEASAQANHNTTRSNRKRSGVAAPADVLDDADTDETTNVSGDANTYGSTRSNREGIAAPADTVDNDCDSLPNSAGCDQYNKAVNANSYGSTRSNKRAIAGPSGTGTEDGTSPIAPANTNTSRSNKKRQVAGDNERELIGHIALVRIGAPTGGDSWCEPFDCATFEDAQILYRDNPTLELPKFLKRRSAEK